MAFLRETLRCLPMGPRTLKDVAQDTVLHTTRFTIALGTKVSVPMESFDGGASNVQITTDDAQEEKVAVSLPKAQKIGKKNPAVCGCKQAGM